MTPLREWTRLDWLAVVLVLTCAATVAAGVWALAGEEPRALVALVVLSPATLILSGLLAYTQAGSRP